jgi:hypothetical protein
VSGWIQVDGELFAVAARRGDEAGTFLWVRAGERHERVHGDLYLPAVAPDALDSALGVAVGLLGTGDGEAPVEARISFGRVRDGRGVLTMTAATVDADVRFELRDHPPDGAFCSRGGSPLEVPPVEVITPPDGGVMASVRARCPRCDSG